MKYLLPNILTLIRPLFLIPIALYLPDHALLALVLFAAAALTDFLDGRLAKRLGAKSTFGAIFDPLADKILYLGMLWFLFDHGVPTVLFFLSAIPETGLMVIRVVAIAKGIQSVIPAYPIGKYKMWVQCGAVIAFLAAAALHMQFLVSLLGIPLAIGALFLSFFSFNAHLNALLVQRK